MTERPYETTVPDDLTAGPASTSTATSGASSVGTTSQSQGMTEGAGTSVGAEAKSVASDAADSGRQVAETAKSGVKDVASEASTQVRQLFDQLRTELDGQASSQGQRAASGLRSLASELREMASSTQQHGLAGEAAQQAADRAGSFADWLENRQPGDMLEELRSLARRRPGAFLLGAAALGVIGGRMTRGLTGDSDSSSAGSMGGTRTAAYPASGTDAAMPAPVAPATSPVRSEPYTVGVRDSDTHAVTSMTGGVTSDPLDETLTEGRGGVR